MHSSNIFFFLINGLSILLNFKPSYENRVLSDIHSSLISSLTIGRTLITSLFLVSNLIFEQTASETSIDSVLFSSQDLVVKENGFEVKAPTGHKSIIFPDNSEVNVLSK